MTGDQALQALKEGNQRFVSSSAQHPNQDMGRVASQKSGQSPFAVILSCADSRVVPEILFDQGIGDIFILRVAGNIAEDDTVIASIEYAVAELHCPLLVVLGHQSCGAVKAAVAGGDLPGHLNSLVKAISPAVAQAKAKTSDAAAIIDQTIAANVRLQVEKLKTLEPIFAPAVNSGGLQVVGATYNLESGSVDWMEV
jgi:carbonic anhydrase